MNLFRRKPKPPPHIEGAFKWYTSPDHRLRVGERFRDGHQREWVCLDNSQCDQGGWIAVCRLVNAQPTKTELLRQAATREASESDMNQRLDSLFGAKA